MAVLGDDRHAVARHAAGAASVDRDAVDGDRTAVEVDQARHQIAELALAVALHTGDTDDLAGAHLEVQVVEHGHAIARDTRVAHDQHRRTSIGGYVGDRWRVGTNDLAGLGECRRSECRGAGAQRHLAADHGPRHRRS